MSKSVLSPIFTAFLIPFILGSGMNLKPILDTKSIGTEIIRKYNLHVEGETNRQDIIMPKNLSGPNWGLKQHVLKRAGYDLLPYVGKPVSLTRYNLVEKYGDARLSLWVISSGNKAIGGFITIRDINGPIPGVFSVNDPAIQ